MDNLIIEGNLPTALATIQYIIKIGLMLLFGFYLINIGNKYIDRSKRITINFKQISMVVTGAVGVLLIFFILKKYPIISKVLTAAIIGVAIAYVIDPFVEKLTKKGLSRAQAVLAVYGIVIIVIATLMVVVVPQLFQELKNLAISLPIYANRWANIFNNYFGDMAPDIKEITGVDIIESFERMTQQITTGIADVLASSISKTTVLLTGLIGEFIQVVLMIALVLVMTFYFVVDKEMYLNRVRSWVPDSLSNDATELMDRINLALGEFIRGRAIMAAFVGLTTMILLLILRIDFAIVIGLITMIADIVPYIGPALGFTPAVLFAVIKSPAKGVIVAIAYFVIQWLENNVIAPRVIGDSMGINPLFVFLAIIIGGGIFGVWGMIVSVPLSAVLMILIEYGIEKYKERRDKKSVEKIDNRYEKTD